MSVGTRIASVSAVRALWTHGSQSAQRPGQAGPSRRAIHVGAGDAARGYTYNTLLFRLDETTPPVASLQSRVESANARSRSPGQIMSVRLYEPDRVSRKSDQAKLQQADNLLLFVRLAATFTASGVFTGCKGRRR